MGNIGRWWVKMELFLKIVNGFQPLTIFAKTSFMFGRALKTPLKPLY